MTWKQRLRRTLARLLAFVLTRHRLVCGKVPGARGGRAASLGKPGVPEKLGILLYCWLGLVKSNLPMEPGWWMRLVAGLKLLETRMGWAGNGRVWDRCNKMQGKESLPCPGV